MKRKATDTKPAVAKKKNVAAKGHKLPDPIAPGQILTDISKKSWIMGKSIGQGGFGEIYLASDDISHPVEDNANYVIKIEPHKNGPLFSELHCYMRIGKPLLIESWMKEKKLKHLAMPKFLGSGSHDYKGQKYRFMVMERFGSDLQKIIDKHNKKFSFKTVCEVGRQILDVLEYIHSHDYIHADIKASNLLVGHLPGTQNAIFLVDYGLACRYNVDGKHKEYKFDQRKAHDGTIEFTSRDAHIGAHSRRGDLEILGYNIIQWLCGKLPWEDKLQDCSYVATKKRYFMDSVPLFMTKCFPDGIPPGVQEYMEYVASLTFDEEPNYTRCKEILSKALKTRGHKDDGKLVFMSATPKVAKPVSKIAGRKVRPNKRSVHSSETGSQDSDKNGVEDLSSPVKRMKSNGDDSSSDDDVMSVEEITEVKVKRGRGKAKVVAKRRSIVVKPKKASKPVGRKAKVVYINPDDEDDEADIVETKSISKRGRRVKNDENSSAIINGNGKATVRPKSVTSKAKSAKPLVPTKSKFSNGSGISNPTPAMLAIMNKKK